MAVALSAVLVLGLGVLPATAQLVDETVAADLSPRGDVDPDFAKDEDNDEKFARRGGDNFKSPKAAERFQRRQEALKQRIAGKPSGKVHEVARGQYVELGLERSDRVFVILVEYGNSTSLTAGVPNYQGPLHNQIAQPDRAVDNSTIWQANYNREHYVDMYFNRMVDYFRKQSSGRYTINGAVTEWVKVPFNGARYGSNTLGDAAAWTMIADAVNIWTNDQIASGKTLDEVKAYLQTFDVWDRYDYNNNGNFDESDGYIDHFQIVHSGEGEETGGGAQGSNAIWSHRWQVWYNRAGVDGPAYNKDGGVEFGGGWGANPTGASVNSANASVSSANPTTIATVTYAHPKNNTGIWVGDYTVQPENGGLGVFAHEYSHDLGLPDHYDTNGGSNSTGFWTLMSSGSYLGDGKEDLGTMPGDLGGWDKIQLGWSNYEIAQQGKFSSHKLGPAESNTKAAQAVVVVLPADKNVFYLYDPAVGSLQYGTKAWWGNKGDNIDTTMVRSLDVPAGASTLQMRLNYQIETNWDYAYVSVSADGGTTWANLAGTYAGTAGTPPAPAQLALTTNTNANGNNLGNGITGTSNNAWRLASFNIPAAYAGKTVLLRLRYKTDAFVSLKGIMADEIAFPGFTDGAENGDNGWTLNGFKATTGIEASNAAHYYVAEYRQYRTYDKSLQTGPYLFGRIFSADWVDHYPYQDGLLITYWDSGEANNNTSLHRGEGLALPIDANPEPLMRVGTFPNGAPLLAAWSNTIQAYDSTFGLEPTDAINLPYPVTSAGVRYQYFQSHPSLPAVPVFDDSRSNYWSVVTPTGGVIVPNTGTSIRVVSTSAQDSFMQIHVGPSN